MVSQKKDRGGRRRIGEDDYAWHIMCVHTIKDITLDRSITLLLSFFNFLLDIVFFTSIIILFVVSIVPLSIIFSFHTWFDFLYLRPRSIENNISTPQDRNKTTSRYHLSQTLLIKLVQVCYYLWNKDTLLVLLFSYSILTH